MKRTGVRKSADHDMSEIAGIQGLAAALSRHRQPIVARDGRLAGPHVAFVDAILCGPDEDYQAKTLWDAQSLMLTGITGTNKRL
jgi:hypothetical protein